MRGNEVPLATALGRQCFRRLTPCEHEQLHVLGHQHEGHKSKVESGNRLVDCPEQQPSPIVSPE